MALCPHIACVSVLLPVLAEEWVMQKVVRYATKVRGCLLGITVLCVVLDGMPAWWVGLTKGVRRCFENS